jgi:hypothetical protein
MTWRDLLPRRRSQGLERLLRMEAARLWDSGDEVAAARFPRWRYTLVDLPCPTFEFARWRFRDAANVEFLEPGLGRELPLRRAHDGIAVLEVLEHVINPLDVVRHLVDSLKPGGTLFLNFSDDAGKENLVESAAERGAVLAYLGQTLEPIVPLHGDEHRACYVKPRAAGPARTP